MRIMAIQQICPSCGEQMSLRRSSVRSEDSVYECRDCHVAYVVCEPVPAFVQSALRGVALPR